MRSRFLAIGMALLLIALSFAFVGCTGFLGCHGCQCGYWVADISVSAGAWQEAVECGDTVYVPEGIGAVEVSADYLCEPLGCKTTYEWTVSAPISMNGTSDTSPCVFQFEIPEDECVTVRVSAFCDDNRCADCSFTICPEEEECDCGQWGDIAVSAGDWLGTTECGGTIDTPAGADVVAVSTNYFCEPEDCEPSYEWTVSVPVAVIDSGTCDTSPCLLEFELPDVCAEVSVSAYCGDTLCDTCTFTICPYVEECECGQWGDITISWGTTQQAAVCGQISYISPDVGALEISASYLCEPPDCETTFFEWQIYTPLAVIDSGTCATGPCLFEFELPYECVSVSISAFCGDSICDECTFTICPYVPPPPQQGDGQEPV